MNTKTPTKPIPPISPMAIVGIDYFEYEGKRYKSLSSIATHITGIQRNGWTFFGFSSARGL